MKLMQVFDASSMPEEAFDAFCEDVEPSNGSYHKVFLNEFRALTEEEWKKTHAYGSRADKSRLYYQWLLDNGATDDVVLVGASW